MDGKSRVVDSVVQAIFSHPDDDSGNSAPGSMTGGVLHQTHLSMISCVEHLQLPGQGTNVPAVWQFFNKEIPNAQSSVQVYEV